ncbi:MAG: RDD family protein, partial [Candidatus Omnitrophica bacterium]|nr:RDD family protein [Candidatus Omnitrophota bacterium]
PGTRFCAALTDLLLLSIITILVLFVWFILFAGTYSAFEEIVVDGPGGGEGIIDFTFALLIIGLFLLFSGYHLFFEWWMGGQTPGKRSFKIRVIRDNGTPMGGMELLIRNLLRTVDFLPFFYVLGGVVSLFHPMYKRLGDIAAGTIVVIEEEVDYRSRTDKKYELEENLPEVANRELTPKEVQILTGFLRRREELLPEARADLANKLAHPFYERYGGDLSDPEAYIEKIIAGKQYES